MGRVLVGPRERVSKHRRCLFERNPVSLKVDGCLFGIPLESHLISLPMEALSNKPLKLPSAGIVYG